MWARTQSSVALSSMEAEYRGMVVGAQEGLLVRNLGEELGYPLQVTLETDSTSAQSAAQRRGVLHVKHMSLRMLFLEELVEQQVITLSRVESKKNAADWLTKAVSSTAFESCLALLPGLHRMVDVAAVAE